MSQTCGEALMRLLQAYGVSTVFGIPGEHTLELYRGIEKSGLHAVTPRNEQGASFMADGYARVTGEPGVCTLITGPGVTNAATGIGQAYADSIPMLVISSANDSPSLGRGWGVSPSACEMPSDEIVTVGSSPPIGGRPVVLLVMALHYSCCCYCLDFPRDVE